MIREKVSNLTYAMHISTHCPKYLQITCTKCCAASPRCVALTNKGGLTNAMTGGWVKTYPLQLYAWNIQVIRLMKCSWYIVIHVLIFWYFDSGDRTQFHTPSFILRKGTTLIVAKKRYELLIDGREIMLFIYFRSGLQKKLKLSQI